MGNRNLSVRQVCQRLSISRPTLHRLSGAEMIACYGVGNGGKSRMLFSERHVRDFLRNSERPARTV